MFHENSSNDQLLTGLGLAMAEAKMLRSLFRARETSVRTARECGFLQRLEHLDREIDYLEAKMLEVKSRANRGLS